MAKKDLNTPYEMIYGAHPIIEMLKAKRRKLLAIYTGKPEPKSFQRVKQYMSKEKDQVKVSYVTKDVLDRMAGTNEHMGVIALVSPFKFATKMFDPAKKPLILLLDSIHDVRNLGAILRSSYCTGVTGVVLCKNQSAPLTAAAFKASAGLAEHLDIYVAASLKHAIVDLKKAGYNFYMAMLNGKDARTVEYKNPACLVIGNEATGISKDISVLGTAITLPQKTTDISYNASVAAGILLFLISSDMKNL